MITITKVENKSQLKEFIRFPHLLYHDSAEYVSELDFSVKNLITDRNPFFEHSKASFYLAKLDRELVGRIAFIENRQHNQFHEENVCFFGFFDVMNNYEVAKALFDKVVLKSREEAYDKIIGPTNLTTNDSCGILTKGFDESPMILMPYNLPYYEGFLRQYGWKTTINLYSYKLTINSVNQFFESNLGKRILELSNSNRITIRNSNYQHFDDELETLRKVYNASNKNNWGFVPLTKNEFGMMAKDLKSMIPPELILFAEYQNEVVGFLVALPDFNFIFKKIRSGKLFPWGIVKFLWYKRKIRRARILILGVIEEFRGVGVDVKLYQTITENLSRFKIFDAEACYVMSDNKIMNSVLKKIGGVRNKEYTIFSISSK